MCCSLVSHSSSMPTQIASGMVVGSPSRVRINRELANKQMRQPAQHHLFLRVTLAARVVLFEL